MTEATGEFTDEEWKSIFRELDGNPKVYGLPDILPGSVTIASFNIRNLGKVENRNNNTWKFLGIACKRFDLVSIQECMDDMAGVYRLLEEMRGEYKLISSNNTGTFPGDRGLTERLVFIYRVSTVQLGEVISDITYDRSKVTKLMYENLDEIIEAKNQFEDKMREYENGERKTKPRLNPPNFLSFIRSPYCVSFSMDGGTPGYKPYQFMAVNAHLTDGSTSDRWNEFEAIMNWLRGRMMQEDRMYYPNFILFAALNLDYDYPDKDFAKMEKFMKNFDAGTPEEVHVNFPFLNVHPNETKQFTSDVSMTQRCDQIGLFFRDKNGKGKGYPTYKDNASMGKDEAGPDFGVFNFTNLFSKVLKGIRYEEMSRQMAFSMRYQHKVSDRMPIWMRLKLSKDDESPELKPKVEPTLHMFKFHEESDNLEWRSQWYLDDSKKKDSGIKPGDVLFTEEFYSGAGNYEGLQFVGGRREGNSDQLALYECHPEYLVFPQEIRSMHQDLLSLRLAYEPLFEKFANIVSEELIDLFDDYPEMYEEFWANPTIAEKEDKKDVYIIPLELCEIEQEMA